MPSPLNWLMARLRTTLCSALITSPFPDICEPFNRISGVVVKPRVVLTAAHVLFDDRLLSYVTEARWFFRKQKGEYEPLPQTPRGWAKRDGYATARTNDIRSRGLSPGESSPESRNEDVAAMYFVETDIVPPAE